jgi:hypothetical protein
MRKDKNIAIQLRRQGKTYNEINRLLDIPKSTLSGWFNGFEIPARIKRRLWTNNQRKWAQSITEYNKKRAIDILSKTNETQQRISKEIGRLTKRELMLVGAALYWAEGNKKDRWRIRISNSDPKIIALIMKFFRDICGVKPDKFIAKVHIYPNISERKAKTFWSRITNIPIGQFRKSLFSISRSSKLKRPFNALPYGTIDINISDVNLVNRIKGWILGLSKV